MPIISRFYGIIIRMYGMNIKQHNSPHIHASYNEYIAVYDLNGDLVDGEMPSKQKKIIEAWIIIHKSELNTLWNLLVNGKSGFTIEPLK